MIKKLSQEEREGFALEALMYAAMRSQENAPTELSPEDKAFLLSRRPAFHEKARALIASFKTPAAVPAESELALYRKKPKQGLSPKTQANIKKKLDEIKAKKAKKPGQK
jgi:hypothetical protein